MKERKVNETRKFVFIFSIVFISIIFLLFFNQITGNWACQGPECNRTNSSQPGTGIYTTMIVVIAVIILTLLFITIRKVKKKHQ